MDEQARWLELSVGVLTVLAYALLHQPRPRVLEGGNPSAERPELEARPALRVIPRGD